VIEKFNSKKAPGEDGLTSEIIIHVFRSFSSFLTEVYNKCLKEGCFPKQWKKSSIIPIIKQGKEDITDASKYRPISLLNVAGTVLDKLMINRILHHVHSNASLNSNQYGFMSQSGTVEAAITVREIIGETVNHENCISVVSLDVRGAFDAAWLNLQELKCPKKLFNLSRSYFSNRTASLCGNMLKLEKPVSIGFPQDSCCGLGFWNTQLAA
jgi:hypothetical protein